MPTHDITLSGNIRAVFPPRCVCCELENPSSTASISVTGSGTSPGMAETVLDAATGATTRHSNLRVTVNPPACPQCAKSLQARHFWKTFWLYAGALGGVAVMAVILTFTGSVWLGMLGIAVGVLGPVIWELKDPPAFTITPANGKVTYEFRSEKCATEFAQRNLPGDTVAGAVAPAAVPPPLP